jgi:voltage-gated potassium channel Kch
MSMGMSLDLGLLLANPVFFIGLVLLLMLTKAILLWLLIRLFKPAKGTAPAVALLLSQSGEFALVLFAVAVDSALLSEGLFQQLLVVVVLSMLATPPLAGLAHRLVISHKGEPEETTAAETNAENTSIVLVGFGRVGHRVGEIFDMRGVSYVAIDYDAELVKRERSAGRRVYYGDARKPDVLRSLGVGKANLVIVTVDDFHATEQVVSCLHRMFPELDILVRGHDREHCRSLRTQGAWFAVSENLEASIALAQAALSRVRVDDAENDTAIERFRKNYYSDTKDKV